MLKKTLPLTILLGIIGSLFGFYLTTLGYSIVTLEFWIFMIFESVFIIVSIFTGRYYAKNL